MILNFDTLYKKYNLEDISGIIHAGAHYGEEYSTYKQHNIENVIFFEPVTANFAILSKNLENEDYVCLVNKALGSKNHKSRINIDLQNNGQSSSILTPEIHLQQYPHIKFTSDQEIDVITLDSFVEEYKLSDQHNFLYMDVQGYELEVLKGAKDTLKNIKYVMTEVNRAEVYKGCAYVEELDEFLKHYNLYRVETDWIGESWGDAFYISKHD